MLRMRPSRLNSVTRDVLSKQKLFVLIRINSTINQFCESMALFNYFFSLSLYLINTPEKTEKKKNFLTFPLYVYLTLKNLFSVTIQTRVELISGSQHCSDFQETIFKLPLKRWKRVASLCKESAFSCPLFEENV